MTGRDGHTTSLSSAVWGAVLGTVVLLAWRFVQPPHYGEFLVDESAPLQNARFSIPFTEPATVPFVPAVITFPVLGFLLGLVIGWASSRLPDGNRDSSRRAANSLSLLLHGGWGIVTGLLCAAALEWFPPAIRLLPGSNIQNSPPAQIELPDIWFSLPLLGLIGGLLMAYASRAIERTRSASSSRR